MVRKGIILYSIILVLTFIYFRKAGLTFESSENCSRQTFENTLTSTPKKSDMIDSTLNANITLFEDIDWQTFDIVP